MSRNPPLRKAVLPFMLAFALLVQGNLFVPAQALVTEPVIVELHGRVSLVVAGKTCSVKKNQFSFHTEALSGGMSLPGDVYVTQDGGYVGLGAYTFYEPGDYSLLVWQVDQGRPGYTYDLSATTVFFHVIEENGALKATVRYEKNGISVGEITFSNSYVGAVMYDVTATTDRTSYRPGDTITFHVTVHNTGDLPVHGVYIRLYVPNGCTFGTVSGPGGAYGAIKDKDHGTWFISTLDKGKIITASLSVTVNLCCPNKITMMPLCEITGSTEVIYTNDPKDPMNIINCLTLQRTT